MGACGGDSRRAPHLVPLARALARLVRPHPLLGCAFVAELRAAGRSAGQLARRYGVSRSTVQRWSDGRHLPTPWSARRALRLHAETLTGEHGMQPHVTQTDELEAQAQLEVLIEKKAQGQERRRRSSRDLMPEEWARLAARCVPEVFPFAGKLRSVACDSRARPVVVARRALARVLERRSWNEVEIGEALGRDRSTVAYLLGRVDKKGGGA